MSFTDKTLTCIDCGSTFTFTAGEQEFHASKGFTNEPRRCPECRSARKAQSGGSSMGNSMGNSMGRSSGSLTYGLGSYSSSGGGYGRSEGSDRGPREMFPAVCSQCGKETEVPFRPRGTKPVYCSDCFSSMRSATYR